MNPTINLFSLLEAHQRDDKEFSVASDSGNEDTSDSDADEHELLRDDANHQGDSQSHERRTAPIVTRGALAFPGMRELFPQRGLLGQTVAVGGESPCASPDSRLYINTNAPFSAIVCGVQGSGKSHSVSVLLENMLIPRLSKIGVLSRPLSGLVLHFGEGGAGAQPSEAAWLACPTDSSATPPQIVVYVSPSSLQTMRTVYAKVGPHVVVEPLLFRKSELDAKAFLSLMAVGSSSESTPLYMQTILAILRDLGESYTYGKFITRLAEKKRDLLPAQLTPLNQRMDLLNSFLEKKNSPVSSARFAPGQLTIVDLSDPFIDPASACGYFEILTRLFVRANISAGKVLVVDEAHKYLGASKGVSGLTQELLSLVRQLRHQGMRVIISTQEPTVVPPVLIDLCGVMLLHRFSSPAWLEHVAKHVSADMSSEEALDRIVRLQTGQAILLAPSGLEVVKGKAGEEVVGQFGRKWVLVKTRRRVTKDGGASILSVDA